MLLETRERTSLIKPCTQRQFQRNGEKYNTPRTCPLPSQAEAGRTVGGQRAGAIWRLASEPLLPSSASPARIAGVPRRPRLLSGERGRAPGPSPNGRRGTGSEAVARKPRPSRSAPPAPRVGGATLRARPRAPSPAGSVRPRPEGLCVPGRAHFRKWSESLERHLTGAAEAAARRRLGQAARASRRSPITIPGPFLQPGPPQRAHRARAPEPRVPKAHLPRGRGAGAQRLPVLLGLSPALPPSPPFRVPQATGEGRLAPA